MRGRKTFGKEFPHEEETAARVPVRVYKPVSSAELIHMGQLLRLSVRPVGPSACAVGESSPTATVVVDFGLVGLRSEMLSRIR